MSTARFRKQGGYKQARNIGTSVFNADGGISTRSHISFHDLKGSGDTAAMSPGTLIWKSENDAGRLEYKDNNNHWHILGTGAYDLWKPGTGTAGYIHYDGGNVGIGIGNPAAKLHVIGNMHVIGNIHVNTENYKNEIGYFTGASGATGNNSTAIGYQTKASGNWSTAMGGFTTASGDYSTAMGYDTVAGASWPTAWSTAMGFRTIASGNSSTAMGWWSKASGTYSTAMGYQTIASGSFSTAMGAFSGATGAYCTAIGNKAYAGGDIQFAIGASGTESTAHAGTGAANNNNVLSILKNGNVGIGTTAPAAKLDISGNIHVNTDNYKNQIGYFPTSGRGATVNKSTAIGFDCTASGLASTAMGWATKASGRWSTAAGCGAKATGDFSVALGNFTDASGNSSVAMGNAADASGNYSTAMGWFTKAYGKASTAMGWETKALGDYSTAMGYLTDASGKWSTAMGIRSGATGNFCTAIGNHAYAGGNIQFAIGADGPAPQNTTASSTINNNVLSILKNGNVGIGTTGPAAKLHVIGEIWSQPSQDLATGNNQGYNLLSPEVAPDNEIGWWRRDTYGGSDHTSYFEIFNVPASSGSKTSTIKLCGRGHNYINPTGGNQNVGIGTTTPTEKLEVAGNAIVTGTMTANSFNPPSDTRIKHNEQLITDALSIISKLKPKHYFKTRKLYDASHNFQLDASGNPLDASGNPLKHMEDYTIERGIIAQEIRNIPELRFVVYGKENNNTPLSVDYNSLHCTHIAATQEIDRKQLADQAKIAALETKVADLETRLASLEAK